MDTYTGFVKTVLFQ